MPNDARDFRVVVDCPRCKRTHWAAGTCPACGGLVLLTPAAEARDDAPTAPSVRTGRKKGRP